MGGYHKCVCVHEGGGVAHLATQSHGTTDRRRVAPRGSRLSPPCGGVAHDPGTSPVTPNVVFFTTKCEDSQAQMFVLGGGSPACSKSEP